MAVTVSTRIPITTTANTGTRRCCTLAVLCLSLLVIVIDTTIVNVAFPPWRHNCTRARQACSGSWTPTH